MIDQMNQQKEEMSHLRLENDKLRQRMKVLEENADSLEGKTAQLEKLDKIKVL